MRALLLSIILFCSVMFTAQTFEWAKKINIYESCQENALFAGADSIGNSYMIGEGFCVVTGPNGYTYSNRTVYKYNSQGNLLWSDTIPGGAWKYAIDKSGNILMAGGSFVRKLSGFDGSSIWSKQFNNRYFKQISITPTNGVMLSGMVYYNSSTDSSAYYKLDVNGNVVWKRIGDFYPTAGHLPIKCTKDGDIYVLRQNNNYQTWVFHIDPSGSTTDLISLPQHTVLAYNQLMDVTDKIYVTSTVSDFNPYYTTIISCYNKNGSLLWTDKLTGKGLMYGLTHDNDNNIYLLPTIMGNLQYKDSNFVYPWGTGVIKLDPQGEYIWTKFVSDNEMIGAVSMHVDESKNIFLAGKGEGTTQFDNHTIATNPEYGDLFIAKLSPPAPVVGINEKQKAESKWQVYPNPTTGLLNISSKDYTTGKKEIKISNVMGQCIFSKACKTSGTEFNEQIDLSAYPKGIYFIEINAGDERMVKKVVVQ